MATQGVKTTEFWAAVLGGSGGVVAALFAGMNGYPWAATVFAAAAVVLPALYIWGRSILKAEQAKETDVIPDNWEPILEKVLDIAESLAKALPAKKE